MKVAILFTTALLFIIPGEASAAPCGPGYTSTGGKCCPLSHPILLSGGNGCRSVDQMDCGDGSALRRKLVLDSGTVVYFNSCLATHVMGQISAAEARDRAKIKNLNPVGEPPTQRPSSEPAQGRSGFAPPAGGKLNPGKGAGCPSGKDANGDPCTIR